MIGRSSTKDFTRYLEYNMLPNFPIKKVEILQAEDRLGPNLGSLRARPQGKILQELYLAHLTNYRGR